MVKSKLILRLAIIVGAIGIPFFTFCQEEAKLPSVESKWKENWKVQIGVTTYRTNMLFHNGDLLIGSNGIDRNYQVDSLDGVYVIEPKTGEIKHHIQHLAINDNDVNGLAVNNKGTLFFGGDMQYIYAYETESYTELWKYHAGSDLESTPGIADLNQDGTEDVIFILENSGVLALDGITGELLWHSMVSTHRGNASPAIYDLNGDGIEDVVGVGYASFALNGKDGSILWDHRSQTGMHASPLIVVNDDSARVYATECYGSFDVYRSEGSKVNGVNLTYGMFSSAVPNGQGFASQAFLTFVYDPSDWEVVKDSRFIGTTTDIQSHNFLESDVISASAISLDIDQDGQVEFLVPSEGGTLYITKPSSKKTEKIVLPAGAEASLFICDYNNDGSQTIFFSGLDGYLRSYEVGKTGEIVWPGFHGPDNNGVFYK